jgi:glutathione S-transferase
MMILRNGPASPFGRKVRIAAALLGLENEIKIEPADTNNEADSLRQQNPLGKIPVLITEDGSALYDSRVILEYLDHRAGGGKIIPNTPKEHFSALRMQALCDGLVDAALLRVYEIRFRSIEHSSKKWLDHQTGKMTRTLTVLEADPPALSGIPHVGQIALACALGYLDLRFEGFWRTGHPRLVAWLDSFASAVSAFATTRATA